jgi:hypothetical protein
MGTENFGRTSRRIWSLPYNPGTEGGPVHLVLHTEPCSALDRTGKWIFRERLGMLVMEVNEN